MLVLVLVLVFSVGVVVGRCACALGSRIAAAVEHGTDRNRGWRAAHRRRAERRHINLQPARRVADALETDDDDLAAEPMHLRQSRCISGRAAVLASSHVAGVGFGAGVGAGVF